MTRDKWIYFPVLENRETYWGGKDKKGTFAHRVVTLTLVKLYTPIFRETELQDYFPSIIFPVFPCREQGWLWKWFSMHTCVNTSGTPMQGVQGLFPSKCLLIIFDFRHTWLFHCRTLAHETLAVIGDFGPIWVVRILKSLYLKFVFSKHICFLSFQKGHKEELDYLFSSRVPSLLMWLFPTGIDKTSEFLWGKEKY